MPLLQLLGLLLVSLFHLLLPGLIRIPLHHLLMLPILPLLQLLPLLVLFLLQFFLLSLVPLIRFGVSRIRRAGPIHGRQIARMNRIRPSIILAAIFPARWIGGTVCGRVVRTTGLPGG
jgi:hypothetical protein